jgi:hypothetical protein
MSGIDQYCEAIPGPGGDRGAGDSLGPGERVPTGAGKALTRRGSPGAARRDASDARHASGSAPSDNPLKAVTSAATSGPTVGAAFVLTLLALAVALIALAWLRARRREPTA